MSNQQQWTVLAHLLRPQGRKGELLAELFTDFPHRFDGKARVFLAKPGYDGPPEGAREFIVSNHWQPVGKNQGRIVLHFATIDSINDAELLSDLDVLVPENQRLELEDDAEYISDLIDCEVFDGSTRVGLVTGVDFPTTPDGGRRLPDVAPILAVKSDNGHEVLIPYVQAFLVKLDVEARRIDMALPAGLVDLNRASLDSEPQS